MEGSRRAKLAKSTQAEIMTKTMKSQCLNMPPGYNNISDYNFLSLLSSIFSLFSCDSPSMCVVLCPVYVVCCACLLCVCVLLFLQMMKEELEEEELEQVLSINVGKGMMSRSVAGTAPTATGGATTPAAVAT